MARARKGRGRTAWIAAPALVVSPDFVRTVAIDLAVVLAIALLAALWLMIQHAWRRTIPEHGAADEAFDVRWGSCGAGCGCAAGSCRRAETPAPLATPGPAGALGGQASERVERREAHASMSPESQR